MKTRWILLIVLAAVALALFVWSRSRPEARVEVVVPSLGTIRAYVQEEAVTELPHDHLVSMPIDGWLEPIALREGDRVKEGQVVAQLESDDLRDQVVQAQQRVVVLETRIAETLDHRLENNALVEMNATVEAIDETVRAAEAKLEATRALVVFAEEEVVRLSRLVASGATSDRELRATELAVRRARAEFQSDSFELAAMKTLAAVSYIGPKFITDTIDRKSFTHKQRQDELIEAKAQLEIASRNLGRTEMRAPVDGVVLIRHQTRRQFLGAGTPLLTIGRLDELEIVAEVLTETATRIDPDDPVQITGRALAEGPIPGKVLRIYPAGFTKISSLGIEQQRVKVAIRPDRRPPRLGVGFRLFVRIIYDQANQTLVVSRTCLFRTDAGDWN